ncbi:MAG: hypothetical protein IKO34_04255 [Bacteroidales bacterium]|nr:hypothetical protein [Bacteroidales bacterium]
MINEISDSLIHTAHNSVSLVHHSFRNDGGLSFRKTERTGVGTSLVSSFMRNLLAVNILLLLAFFFSSCSNSIHYKQVSDDFSNVESTADKSHIDSILNQLPKYSEICKNIRLNKVKFNADILFDVRTIDLYQNSKETAVAMGMLVADLGYARYFERVQICTDILDATKMAAEKLAVESDVFSEYVPRIEENLNDEQVIFATIDSLLDADVIVPSENEKYGVSAMFICGFWLEVTYLGLDSDVNENDANANSMKNHFAVLHQINELLAQLSDEDVIENMKSDFRKLEENGASSPSLKTDVESIRGKFVKIL